MKNFKIVLATLFLILILVACQKAETEKGPILESINSEAALMESCTLAKGNWVAEFKECEFAGKEWCEASGGAFEECGSACRHEPKAEICTMQCVPVCEFGIGALEFPLVGGDRDPHGCIGSAGYMWCEPKTKCLRIWEEACFPAVDQEIAAVFAKKMDKPLSKVYIRVIRQEGNYVLGSVKIGDDIEGEGGMFLGAKIEDEWQIPYSGNGSIACKELEPYGFPEAMAKEICSD